MRNVTPMAASWLAGMTFVLAGCGGVSGPAGRVAATSMPVPGEADTELLVLQNRYLSVSFLPELGGKISSIRDAAGREYVSRSTVPYSRRTYGMDFGETEFDGIDEIFPTLGACPYPAGPWEGTPMVGHGELFTAAWRRVAGRGVTLEADGVRLPYVFRREAVLEGPALVLRYTVRNLSDEPMPFLYLFHPLLKGQTGAGLVIPDETRVRVGPAKDTFLAEAGDVKRWSQLRDERGRPFAEFQFARNSGGYYKYYTDRSIGGQTSLRYPDGSGLAITWSPDVLPYMAVWASEGGVRGLNHLAPEPTVAPQDRLDEAYRAGQAGIIPPSGTVRWWIRMELIDY